MKLSIYYPGGNTTALVLQKPKDQFEKVRINNQILKAFPDVEQVGFVWQYNDNNYLEMAGGEFCGNAARSAIYKLIEKKKALNLIFIIDGQPTKLTGGKYSNGDIWVQIPFEGERYFEIDNYFIVLIKGITNVVIEKNSFFTSQKAAKIEAKKILEKLDLLKYSASGVIFLIQKKQQYFMEPVVWVKKIKTFFYETACGSGTAAVGEYLFNKNKTTIQQIIQPSKSIITIYRNKGDELTISGTVKNITPSSTTHTKMMQ